MDITKIIFIFRLQQWYIFHGDAITMFFFWNDAAVNYFWTILAITIGAIVSTQPRGPIVFLILRTDGSVMVCDDFRRGALKNAYFATGTNLRQILLNYTRNLTICLLLLTGYRIPPCIRNTTKLASLCCRFYNWAVPLKTPEQGNQGRV